MRIETSLFNMIGYVQYQPKISPNDHFTSFIFQEKAKGRPNDKVTDNDSDNRKFAH